MPPDPRERAEIHFRKQVLQPDIPCAGDERTQHPGRPHPEHSGRGPAPARRTDESSNHCNRLKAVTCSDSITDCCTGKANAARRPVAPLTLSPIPHASGLSSAYISMRLSRVVLPVEWMASTPIRMGVFTTAWVHLRAWEHQADRAARLRRRAGPRCRSGRPWRAGTAQRRGVVRGAVAADGRCLGGSGLTCSSSASRPQDGRFG